MSLVDTQEISIKEFRGLFDRGGDDNVPQSNFSLCQNCEFKPQSVMTRRGVNKTATLGYTGGKVSRFFMSLRSGAAEQLLVCDGANNLYVWNSATPLLTVTGMTDFSAVNFFDRVYITPHNGVAGVGSGVYVWNPSATPAIRLAAGAAPTAASTMVGADGVAGSIDAGVHKFAVVYEYDSGFQTPPGVKVAGVFTPLSYSAPGAKKVNLSNIPVGPSGVVKRHILVTKSGQALYFFAPFGTINDNVTTTLTLNFFDTDLVDSADYLFDLLETIPAGIGIGEYRGRLHVYGAPEPNGSLLRVSRAGDPESFSSIDGFLVVNKNDSYKLKNHATLHDVLYVIKETGCFSIQDNGQEPANWDVQEIDLGVSGYAHNISTSLPGSRQMLDKFLLADKTGLLLFRGTFQRPALTWGIQDLWNRINFVGADSNAPIGNKIEVVEDPIKQEIFINVPLDGATTPTHVIYGDYSEAVNVYGTIEPERVKWSLWKFHKNPTAIVLEAGSGSDIPALRFGTMDASAGYIWGLISGVLNDDGNAIDSFIKTYLIESGEGVVNFFQALRLRITGAGNLEITVEGEDSFIPTPLKPFVLQSTPGKHYLRLMNFVNEKMAVKLRVSTLNSSFNINDITAYYRPAWPTRPA